MSSNTDAGTFLTFFLTARGHGALGRADLKPVLNAGPFEAGLKTRSASFVDPDVVTWNEHFQEDIHAILLIADDHEVVRNTKRAAVLSLIRHLMARRGITHGQRVVSPNTPDLASAHEDVLLRTYKGETDLIFSRWPSCRPVKFPLRLHRRVPH